MSTKKDEFYQPLTYRDDVDLEKKLAVWERFYNFDRPDGEAKCSAPARPAHFPKAGSDDQSPLFIPLQIGRAKSRKPRRIGPGRQTEIQATAPAASS